MSEKLCNSCWFWSRIRRYCNLRGVKVNGRQYCNLYTINNKFWWCEMTKRYSYFNANMVGQLKRENKKLKDENEQLKQQNEFLKRRCNEYWEEARLNSDYFEWWSKLWDFGKKNTIIKS